MVHVELIFLFVFSIIEEQAFVVHAGLPLDPKVPCDICTCVRSSLYLILNVGGR